MAIPVQTPTIERHPLRDAYMVNAPEEVNPMRVPFIGTRKECEKVLSHMKKQLVKEGYELAEIGFCKLARAYAKEHNIIALDFRKDCDCPSDEGELYYIEFGHIGNITDYIPETEDVKDVSISPKD